MSSNPEDQAAIAQLGYGRFCVLSNSVAIDGFRNEIFSGYVQTAATGTSSRHVLSSTRFP